MSTEEDAPRAPADADLFSDRCESCGWGALGAMFVDFRDGGPVFLVCASCGQVAVDLGANASVPPHLAPDLAPSTTGHQ